MIPLRTNIPSKIIPFITWSIIAANGYVFYLQMSGGSPIWFDKFINHWAVIPSHLLSNPKKYWYTLITAAFLHGGWMHIIGNMVFLYIFGPNVEDRMGHFKFLIFYILIGVIANGSQAFISQTSKIPLIGASGAIAGVLGSYFFYYPYAQVLTLVPILFFIRVIEIPAFLFLGFWFLMQTLSSTASMSAQMAAHQASGGVAFLAHAVGFIAGLIFSPFFGDKRSRFK
jgi:membrane associated rhomboid family serine protease